MSQVQRAHKRAAKRSFSTAGVIGLVLALLEHFVPAWRTGVPVLVNEIVPVVVAAAVGYVSHLYWVQKLLPYFE